MRVSWPSGARAAALGLLSLPLPARYCRRQLTPAHRLHLRPRRILDRDPLPQAWSGGCLSTCSAAIDAMYAKIEARLCCILTRLFAMAVLLRLQLPAELLRVEVDRGLPLGDGRGCVHSTHGASRFKVQGRRTTHYHSHASCIVGGTGNVSADGALDVGPSFQHIDNAHQSVILTLLVLVADHRRCGSFDPPPGPMYIDSNLHPTSTPAHLHLNHPLDPRHCILIPCVPNKMHKANRRITPPRIPDQAEEEGKAKTDPSPAS